MSKVIATGMVCGKRHTFEATLVDGALHVECKTKKLTEEEQKTLMRVLLKCIRSAPPIAETYVPPENSLSAAYNGFNNRFFPNDDYEVKVEGELEEIPYEEGVIY